MAHTQRQNYSFCKSKQYLPKHLIQLKEYNSMDCLCNLVGIFLILFILAISISSISPKCQYWIKTVFMYIYYLTTAAIVIPFGLVSRNPTKSSNLWALLYRHVSWLVLGLKWNTIGKCLTYVTKTIANLTTYMRSICA